jgi:D-alanyl-lipoteichoic acid acyltransferase DltB (MBOAT superfamily)
VKRRFKALNGDMIVGLFFATILAPSLKPYFYLNESTHTLDVIIWALLFEFYVYFNFCGFSLISFAFLRLFGIKAIRNFNQPFGAGSIVEYWQRWHLSFSHVLKQLYFLKIRSAIGLYGAVFVVFMASAVWHGITPNFLLWGIFHSCLWCVAHLLYQRGFAGTNYVLLLIGIVVGRVISSELDWELLKTKLSSLFFFSNWDLQSDFFWMTVGSRDNINIFLVVTIIAIEIGMRVFGVPLKKYEYLRHPLVSALLMVYVALAFVGVGGAPVYGNR